MEEGFEYGVQWVEFDRHDRAVTKEKMFKTKAAQFNTASNRKRAIMNYASMADWFRISWNKPQSGSSPVKMYVKLLRPKGKDTEGNIIYEYIGPK